jgi:hypothetical protein
MIGFDDSYKSQILYAKPILDLRLLSLRFHMGRKNKRQADLARHSGSTT